MAMASSIKPHCLLTSWICPTGIALWKDGALITLAGQLEWMRDNDHDGAVDQREVWLEGFAKQNEQLRANHPRVELDGKIYVAVACAVARFKWERLCVVTSLLNPSISVRATCASIRAPV